MYISFSHIKSESHHNLINGTYYSCERGEYEIMVLWEYTIISPFKISAHYLIALE